MPVDARVRSAPAVALVTTDLDALHDPDEDLELIIEALAHEGVGAEGVMWRDTRVDWARFDLALVRSPWDYPDRLPDFLAWLDRVERLVPIVNPPAVVRWNLDKRYLADLAGAGLTIVPSHYPATVDAVAEALRSMTADEVVIKPTVSAGSRDTGRFDRDDPKAIALARHIISIGKSVLLQPAVTTVATAGEHGLLYFDGAFSHAVRKGPILAAGGGLLGGSYVEDISATKPSPEEIELADAAMRAVASIVTGLGVEEGAATPLYARLDLVDIDGRPALLEAELFEPSYFLSTAPGAAQRFAQAVVRRLH